MSFNGAGTFSINTAGNPVVTGTTISSTWANALTADLATGLSTTVCKDGQTTTTAAVPFALGLTTPTGYGLTAGGSQALIGYFAKRATANQSITSSTTLASATNMSFAIAASEEWMADFDLDVGALLSTTGIKLAATVPAGATLNISAAWVGSAGLNQCGQGRTTSSGTAIDFTAAAMGAISNAQIRVILWVLNSSTAGTVQLQFAQSTSDVTAVTIRKGSHMLANRVA